MAYVVPPTTKKNALATVTTAGILVGAVTIPISDCSICYDVNGNLITQGYVLRNPNSLTTPPPEEIIITSCSVAYGVGGPGNVTGVTRAVNYDANTGGVAQGAAYAWPAGTVISPMISIGIYNILINDIIAHQTALAQKAIGPGSSVAGDLAVFGGTDGLTLVDGGANIFKSTQPFGVKWNTASSSPALTRINWLGNTVTLATADFNNHIVWGGMKRCNLSDTGFVNAWYGDTGFSYTGSNGQVMVWVPKFWYNAVKDAATGYISYWISGQALAGYKVHPAFITNGKEMNGFYIGAFEACTYSVGGSAYNTTDAAGVNTTQTTGDKLASITGAKPTSGKNNSITLPLFRVLAQNRGTGWNLQNFNQLAAVELLYLIEYASFYSQSVLSVGVTNISDDGSTNMAVNSGFTAGSGTGSSDLGNASGQVSISHYQTAQTTYPLSYRGIENLYGNIWTWADGINISNNVPWIADNGFASSTYSAPYVSTGLTLLQSNDFVTQIAFSATFNHGFLASTGGGSSSTYLTNYYYQSTGDMAALFGGLWILAAYAGAFCWYLNNAASFVNRFAGARLAFFA